MNIKWYHCIIFDDNGQKGVTVPEFDNCFTFGEDVGDAIDMAKDAVLAVLSVGSEEKVVDYNDLVRHNPNDLIIRIPVDIDDDSYKEMVKDSDEN